MARKKRKKNQNGMNVPGRAALGAGVGSMGGAIIGGGTGFAAGAAAGSPQAAAALGGLGLLTGSIAGGALGGGFAVPEDYKKRARVGGGIGGAFGPWTAALGAAVAAGKSDRKGNPSKMNKKGATEYFAEVAMPMIEEQEIRMGDTEYANLPFRREEWNAYVRGLYDEGMISERQMLTWEMPKKFTRKAKRMYANNPKACGRGKIRVDRKGYYREDGTYVDPTTYCMEDRGKPGKGPDYIGEMKEGTLGIHYSKEPKAKTRQKKLRACVKKYGYQTCVGKVNALRVLNKNTWPKKWLKMVDDDLKYLQKTYRPEEHPQLAANPAPAGNPCGGAGYGMSDKQRRQLKNRLLK